MGNWTQTYSKSGKRGGKEPRGGYLEDFKAPPWGLGVADEKEGEILQMHRLLGGGVEAVWGGGAMKPSGSA